MNKHQKKPNDEKTHKRGGHEMKKHQRGGHKKHHKPKGRGLMQIEEPQWVIKPITAKGVDWRERGVETKVQEVDQCGDPFVF